MTETIQESHIASSSSKPAKQKKFWIGVVGGIVALSVLAVGFQAYKKHSFKSALRPYALKDNILTEDILNLESESKITIVDYFDKAKKNIEAREQIIQDVRMLDPGSYKKELDMHVEIMTLENEYVQSKVAALKAYIGVESAKSELKRLDDACNASWFSFCNNNLPTLKGNVEYALTGQKIAAEEYIKAYKKWLSKEEEYHKGLSSFLPERNLIAKLKEIGKT